VMRSKRPKRLTRVTIKRNNCPRLARFMLLRSNWDQQLAPKGLNNKHDKSGKAL
jgi:hypothetical protein